MRYESMKPLLHNATAGPERPGCSWEMLRDWSFCSAFLSRGVIALLRFNTAVF